MENTSGINTAEKYIGVKWYNLTVTGEGINHDSVVCLCDCGNTIELPVPEFRVGRIKSCGCNKGISMDEEATLEKLWKMAGRIIGNTRTKKAKITVCEDWQESKILFVDWALKNGYQPGLYLKRIDEDGDFEPSNCKWDVKQARPMVYNGLFNTFTEPSRDIPEESHSIRVQIGKSDDAVAFRGFKDKGYAIQESWDEIPTHDLTESEISKYFLEV